MGNWDCSACRCWKVAGERWRRGCWEVAEGGGVGGGGIGAWVAGWKVYGNWTRSASEPPSRLLNWMSLLKKRKKEKWTDDVVVFFLWFLACGNFEDVVIIKKNSSNNVNIWTIKDVNSWIEKKKKKHERYGSTCFSWRFIAIITQGCLSVSREAHFRKKEEQKGFKKW